MAKKDNAWIILSIVFIIFFILSIIIGIYFYNSKTIETSQLEKKALLDVEIYDWGYNEYDSSELLFDYWISNYGDIEAKNIKVNCKLVDEEGTYFSSIDFYGNLASRSTEFGEFTPKKTSGLDMQKEYSGFCYVESCDNCEILYKRIPDLIESYNR